MTADAWLADAHVMESRALSPVAVLVAVFVASFLGGFITGIVFGFGAPGAFSRGGLFLAGVLGCAVGAGILKPLLQAITGASIRFVAAFLALAGGSVVATGVVYALSASLPPAILLVINLAVSLAVSYAVVRATAEPAAPQAS